MAGIRFRYLGLILGGLSALVGILAILSKDPEDKKPGLVLTLAGALELASLAPGGVKALAGTLLSIGAVGFIVRGLWNGFKFLKGLKRLS